MVLYKYGASIEAQCFHGHFRGGSMELQWCFRGGFMALPSKCHDASVGLPWCIDGASSWTRFRAGFMVLLALPWSFHGSIVLSRVFPWCLSGASVVLASVESSWRINGIAAAWCFGGPGYLLYRIETVGVADCEHMVSVEPCCNAPAQKVYWRCIP